MARVTDFVMLQSITLAGETYEWDIDWRHVDGAHPAERGHTGAVGLDLDRFRFTGRIAERSGMNPGDMRRVQQIVGHVEVIAIDRHRIAVSDAPGRIAVVIDAEDRRRLRQLRVAHPDPEQPVAR